MVQKSVWTVIKEQRARVPPGTTADLTGQTVVVVGANTGIGYETAAHFARMNPGKLVLACRNEEKGKAAVSRIQAETGFERAELRLLDLGKFASVRAFADTFQNEERLDILVMNAGVAPLAYRVTSDGWEETLQVNNLSTSLTCLLLLPKMTSTATTYNTHPRIVVVSSDMHYWAKIDDRHLTSPEGAFKSLNAESFQSAPRYMQTKLLNVFFVRSLASLLSRTPIIVNAVNPGYCISDMRRDVKGFQAYFHSFMEKLLAYTTEEGARQLVWAALGGKEDVDKLRGAYVSTMKVDAPADFVTAESGKEKEDKLWADLIRVLTEVDGRVADIVKQYS
ncbi:hypothetical protein NMY22_g9472 [Coprinellus aureogranulatus]|nr:hypothetical protein NMY22_g9472 [Coprinellus aureogranulatus]